MRGDSNISRYLYVKDPIFLKNVEIYIKEFNCEASYFTETCGNITLIFVLDLPSTGMVHVIAKSLFQEYEANIEIHPAMKFDDFNIAITRIQ